MKVVSIIDIEYSLPEKILTNEELAAIYTEWTVDKIFNKTGIKQRHVVKENECASDLAIESAKKILTKHNVQIDYIIYCSQSPDYILPSTACVIQTALDIPTSCGALDINLGCSGYIYGLGLAKGLIQSEQANTVLLLTADHYTKYIHPMDKSTRTIFGDAGTSTLISSELGMKLTGPFVYGTDGRGKENLIIPTRGGKKEYVPNAESTIDGGGNVRNVNNLYMNGTEIFVFASKIISPLVEQTLQNSNLTMDDIDLFIFHQANEYMLRYIQRKMSIPNEKFIIDFEDIGNTVSCTIPIALKRTKMKREIKSGSKVMLVGFGVGYSWGATIIEL
jgi:3-oxoacyl-[acyl-carrier-protein] synthase III